MALRPWRGLSANLGCRSETCCTMLTGNAGRKKIANNSPSAHHRTTLQLRHVSTIGKKLLNRNISFTCPHNMVNFGPLAVKICWRVWGCKGLTVLVYFYSHCRYITTVGPFVHLYDTKPDVLEEWREMRWTSQDERYRMRIWRDS